LKTTKLRIDEYPQPGTIIGPYVISEVLWNGGQGIISRAQKHDDHGEPVNSEVALKILSKDYRQHDEAVDQFLEEARQACHLAHPHLAHGYAYDTDPRWGPWYAMELVDGVDLFRRVESEAPLSEEEAATLLIPRA